MLNLKEIKKKSDFCRSSLRIGKTIKAAGLFKGNREYTLGGGNTEIVDRLDG